MPAPPSARCTAPTSNTGYTHCGGGACSPATFILYGEWGYRAGYYCRLAICVLLLRCGFCGAFLRRLYLKALPCGCLRRPRRDRGIAISGSALCACAPSVPCGCTAAALQSRCARPTRPSLDSRVPLCTAAAPLMGWMRRSGALLRGALPQGQGVVCAALHSTVALQFMWRCSYATSCRRGKCSGCVAWLCFAMVEFALLRACFPYI